MLGLLTFHWADDYGAMLQAYALKRFCGRYGDVKIIPYVPNGLEKRYKLFKTDGKEELKKTLRMMRHVKSFGRRLKRRIKMLLFRRKYLTKEKSFSDLSLIPAYESNIKCYIVGSDQVWNPEITNGIAQGYFCDFRKNTENGCHCIAYAASIGVDRLDEKYDAELKRLLANFDLISVREASAVPYISSLCEKSVQAVLDPVFLLEREEWRKALPKAKTHTPYIFVYYTEKNPRMLAYVEELGKEKGLKVCIFNYDAAKNRSENTEYIGEIDPFEFLSYMDRAAYVVTNSFHGLAFSIILQKQFALFTHSNKNSRLNDLVVSAGLEERKVCDAAAYDIDTPINWSASSARLSGCIAESRKYLEKSIGKFG